MATEDDSVRRHSKGPTQARLTEIAYHKKMNRWIVYFCLPVLVFFALFYYHLGNIVLALLFALLSVNAIVAVAAGYRIENLRSLVRLKYITSAFAFLILAASLIYGVTGKEVYIVWPWIFTYPLGVMLFFGPLNGFYSALVFCAVMSAVIMFVHPPAWNAFQTHMFKLNSVLSLFFLLGVALISEKARVRVQRHLVDAQNESKSAEKSQRQANIELQREIERRVQSETELAQSEARYRALFEESAASLWEEDWSEVKPLLDELIETGNDLAGCFKSDPKVLQTCLRSTRVTAVNRATLRLYEAEDAATLLGNITSIFMPGASDYFAERVVSLYEKGLYEAQTIGRTLKGRQLHLLVSSTVPAGYEHSWERIFTSVYDITKRMIMEEEKRRVEQQLQHGRQLQALSTLAGGIAHQFNNALAVITGNVDLARFKQNKISPNGPFIDALQNAVDRMRRLTDQLVAYARGGKYQPRPFSANDLILGIINTGKTAVPPFIQVDLALDPDLSSTRGDTTQIKTVFEAVIANAVESMTGDGKLLVSTGNRAIAEAPPATAAHLPSGHYVVISVEDRGVGMDEPTRQRIFEPFFTTKYFGRGLGMAAAFGIVKNHDGMITVESEPNNGTRITIYLPAFMKRSSSDNVPDAD